jgi:hypothetical protein
MKKYQITVMFEGGVSQIFSSDDIKTAKAYLAYCETEKLNFIKNF